MSPGRHAPLPFKQHQARTLFLRVPLVDWPRVASGEKTEFRTRTSEDGQRTQWANTPTPVVAYVLRNGEYDSRLMMLLEHRREALIALATDRGGLRREGFDSWDHFHAYWRQRTKKAVRGLDPVHVWRVRPWLPQDEVREGVALLRRLYGEHL